MGYDSGTYGRSFADVYDDWYPPTAVEPLRAWIGARFDTARILELGVGTGRVAIALAAAGHRVTGMDSSPEMLTALRANDPAGTVEIVEGDAARAEDYPAGPFDVVLATNNLLVNLADRAAQADAVASMAGVLADTGRAVIDGVVGATHDGPQRGLETRRVEHDRVVLIATERDVDDGSIRGSHVELSDAGIRLRPWRLVPIEPDELDELCRAAGLDREERRTSFDDPAWSAADADRHLSVYRRR